MLALLLFLSLEALNTLVRNSLPDVATVDYILKVVSMVNHVEDGFNLDESSSR